MTGPGNKVIGGLSVPQSSKRQTKRSDAVYKYRYEITAASKGAPVKVGAIVVETRYMGLGHCWSIFNTKTFKITSSFTGKYLGRRSQLSSQDSSQ